ncbi:carbohydrate ABC transporter ATP-binding protein, CUT1 family [Jatrophihabitans endophyticus]|uniref:Carbohydrate ABC transporter ATP-binding protein, CUT1 family n=1 Tax=Jatrophihabitans endophyticus TaxID=1206085 RepID=A0A1M5DLL4_9ACTN|nr:sn-glycerol-3-phosphate ABC transporter ATP-binding protein UgpC [Jatrophihabitans endophyticus]SHF67774.1 carbohydrate ABC transporter ATP-binding protein, CUT1 family [Jatrophihabitans endophyticus]
MAEVRYDKATCHYPGNPNPAVVELDLDIKDGEFVVLVGPSGSGKSTALRMLAGLEDVSSGSILIDGVDVSHKPPKDRDIAMVFQSYALYPHMSVGENMGFALKLSGVSKTEREQKVREAAKLLNLTEYLDRKPKALSGGQRQRVAMGRAIVREPAVFLMDEPLSNLDAKLRVETRSNIATLQARLGTTTLYVTHDQVEAMTMGHRVAILKEGGFLQQVDTPRNLYDRPANSFVAGFIGSPAMNLRTVPLVDGGAKLGNIVLPLQPEAAAAARTAGLDRVTLGVRPESFQVSNGAGDGFEKNKASGLKIEVKLVEELGADAYVYGSIEGEDDAAKPYCVRFDGRVPPRIGEVISVDARTNEEHAFHPETGERLG